jgi:hypothetical protein
MLPPGPTKSIKQAPSYYNNLFRNELRNISTSTITLSPGVALFFPDYLLHPKPFFTA